VLGPALGALAFLAGQDARALNARLAGCRVRLAIAATVDGSLAGVTVEGIIREVISADAGRGVDARKPAAVAVIHLDPHPRVAWREVAVHVRRAGYEPWMARWIPVPVHVHLADRAHPLRLGEHAAATATMRLTIIARERTPVRDPAAAGVG
jgi:hypothetical protein